MEGKGDFLAVGCAGASESRSTGKGAIKSPNPSRAGDLGGAGAGTATFVEEGEEEEEEVVVVCEKTDRLVKEGE